MGEVIESGIGTLNYGRQEAKGTAAEAAGTAVGTNRPKWFEGVLKPGKTLGSEEYIDGRRFASPSQYTDTIGGMVGTLTLQAQPENCCLFPAQVLGVDTVTGSADPWTHTATSAGTSGSWGTWWQKVGSTVGPERESYIDSKIAKLVMKAGDKDKTLHQVLDIACLNPAVAYLTDPAKTEDSSDPFYWSEVKGTVTLDSTVLSEVHEEVIEIDTAMKPYWGDDIAPAQLIEGKGTITSTVASIVTASTLAKYRKTIYGKTEPEAGDKPVKEVFFAKLISEYVKSTTRTLKIERPKVAVKPDEMEVGPNREGGEIPISFGGLCEVEGSTPALTIVAKTGDETSYV